jgi:hypothetical protein
MKVKRLIEEWGMDKLRRLCVSKSITGGRDKDLSKREGFGDWLRDIRRARGRI